MVGSHGGGRSGGSSAIVVPVLAAPVLVASAAVVPVVDPPEASVLDGPVSAAVLVVEVDDVGLDVLDVGALAVVVSPVPDALVSGVESGPPHATARSATNATHRRGEFMRPRANHVVPGKASVSTGDAALWR